MEKTARETLPEEQTMEKTARGRLPEEILMVILPGLPLKTLATFKCVSKPWKSLIESPYFRRLFVSLHKKSSPSWSLMLTTTAHLSPTITEAFGFHGCQTWDLPKSPGSYFIPDPTNLPSFYRASSNGLVLLEIGNKSLVGNPVLHQWVEIPPPPKPCAFTGLVTRVEEDGAVSSFKVVRTCESSDGDMNEWRVYVYSSESGLWSYKQLFSSHPLLNPSSCSAMSLNQRIYLLETSLDPTRPDVLIAYDFYNEVGGDECKVIPLPLADLAHLMRSGGNSHLRRCLTSTRGDVVFIELIDRRLMMWRLKKDDSWLEFRMTHLISVGYVRQCFPLAMNPFDCEFIYLWSLQHGCFVSVNLWGQRFKVHQESENWNWRSSNEGCCRLNTNDCKGYMKGMFDAGKTIVLSQFVLPPWMDSVPTIPLN